MDEQTRLTYSRQLRSARANAGMTQQEVAEAAGVSRNTYASMESGAKIPQSEKLWSVMLVLGIRPDRTEPEWLQEWWRIIEPLARRLPEESRGVAMGRIVKVLHDAIEG